MKYLLDTNICIYIIKKKPLSVIKKFSKLAIGEIGISSITYAELEFGACKSQQRQKNQDALAEFTSPLEIVSFDDMAATEYGKIRVYLEKKGKPIGSLDTLIAAQAVALQTILVTNNTKEFSRVPGIKIESWI